MTEFGPASSGHWRDASFDSFSAAPPRVPPLERTTQIAYILTIAAAVGYAIFLFHPGNRGDLIPWLVLLAADGLVLFKSIGSAWTILAGDRPQESAAVVHRRRELTTGVDQPTVDVLIAVYGEPLDIVERTVRAARDLRLPHRTIVCDDGADDRVATLAAQLGVDYRSRSTNVGAKAGNMNEALAATEGDFVAIFDADMVAHPDFLIISLAYFEDPQLAFVQAPQTYWNDDTFIARAAAGTQQIFYELICPGTNAFNSMFHVGTNALFRRAALESVGGFHQESNSEDIWTSLRLHQAGWASRFVPENLARGQAPQSLQAFLRQQDRWATGAFEILLRGRPYLSRELTLDQRLQYTISPLHFALSLSILWFSVLPALFLLFGIQPLGVDGSAWLLRYLPFWLLTNAAIWLQCGGLNLGSMAISLVAAPTHARALLRVVLGRRVGWSVTNRSTADASIVELMPVQLAIAAFNVTGLVVGLLVIDDPSVTLIALALCAFHASLIGWVGLTEIQRRRRRRAVPPIDQSRV